MDLLVTCEWLQAALTSGNHDNLVVVDVSWSSTEDCEAAYKQCHIPGARYVNVLKADHTDLHPRNIPSAEVFTDLAQSAGINKNSHIVVYSNSMKASYFLSGRGWWTFKYYGHDNVSILDGGLPRWKKLGYPTNSDIPQVKRGDFECKDTKEMYRSYDDVANNVDKQQFQVVDTRPAAAYQGSQIPGAKNIPMPDLVDEDEGILKSKEDIEKAFTEAGVDLTRPVVTHCNSGMSSCTVAFAALLSGNQDVAVFHGGFTEWQKRKPVDG